LGGTLETDLHKNKKGGGAAPSEKAREEEREKGRFVSRVKRNPRRFSTKGEGKKRHGMRAGRKKGIFKPKAAVNDLKGGENKPGDEQSCSLYRSKGKEIGKGGGGGAKKLVLFRGHDWQARGRSAKVRP